MSLFNNIDDDKMKKIIEKRVRKGRRCNVKGHKTSIVGGVVICLICDKNRLDKRTQHQDEITRSY